MIQQTSFAEPTMLDALRHEIAKQPPHLKERIRFIFAVAELGKSDPRFCMRRGPLEAFWQLYREGSKG